jgi:hypothetical protein
MPGQQLAALMMAMYCLGPPALQYMRDVCGAEWELR